MTNAELFMVADSALTDVIKQIQPEQWAMTVPDDMSWHPGPHTLHDIINYHAYDEAWVPDVLAGKTAAEVGTQYDGDLLGDDPMANYGKYVELAQAAVGGFSAPEQIVHLSYGDYSADDYLTHISLFRGLRVYDIAKLIGADLTMPEALVAGLWAIVEPQAEELRKMGVFGPAVEVPADAPLQDRLLGLTGRMPRGAAA